MGTVFDPRALLLLLLSLFGTGVRDLASCLPTEDYWKAKQVTVSFEQMSRDLVAVKPADVSKLINDLDADDPKTREAATAKITVMGQAAVPGLEEAATSGSPEVARRANGIIAQIRATSKVSAIRRLMAIRTLGELKKAEGIEVLRPLLDSKEMFEADYARMAIAKIEGKEAALAGPTDAQRAADLALLPARLDMALQVAPSGVGTFSPEKLLSQTPEDAADKAKAIEIANQQILTLLETIGNVRLDVATWGFYAAPPGQPGNSMVIARGKFDVTAFQAMLVKSGAKSTKADGINIFRTDDDSAILVAPEGRVIFLSRESNGELALDAMTTALKKHAGDLADNAELTKLIKSIDTKSPFWLAATLSVGMKELVGPLAPFESATIVATPRIEKDGPITDIHLQATAADVGQARTAMDALRLEAHNYAESSRKDQQRLPYYKPVADLLESIKTDVADNKMTATGSMRDFPSLLLVNEFSAQGRFR